MEIRDALSQQNGPSEASNEVQDFGRQREFKRVLHFRDIPENMPASMSIPFRFLEASLLHNREPTVVRALVPICPPGPRRGHCGFQVIFAHWRAESFHQTVHNLHCGGIIRPRFNYTLVYVKRG